MYRVFCNDTFVPHFISLVIFYAVRIRDTRRPFLREIAGCEYFYLFYKYVFLCILIFAKISSEQSSNGMALQKYLSIVSVWFNRGTLNIFNNNDNVVVSASISFVY